MGLFKKRNRLMEGFEPLSPRTTLDEALHTGSELHLGANVDVRNDFANTWMAWAENQSEDLLGRVRNAIFQSEWAVNAKDYVEAFAYLGPEHQDAELPVAKQQVLLLKFTQDQFGAEVNERNYQDYFGPHIPKTIDALYVKGIKQPLLDLHPPEGRSADDSRN